MMQGRLRSELLVAVVAILLVVFVLLSAGLLSSVNGATVATATTGTPIANATDAPTQTSTLAVLPTSATDAPTQASTLAVLPTSATDAPTQANRGASNTPTQTMTATPTLTRTATLTMTHTRTATATWTRTPSPTFTPTPTMTYTRTLRPTATRTPSPTPTPTATLTPTDEPCQQPEGWVVYRVQSGNTLFSIARASGSSTAELRAVNCIADANVLFEGQEIFVPRNPSQSSMIIGGGGQGTSVQELRASGCLVPETQLISPSVGARVAGMFDLVGTAKRDSFWYYKIEIRAQGVDGYDFYADGYAPVENGILARVNTRIFGTGLYFVRLSVVDATGGIRADAFCEIPLYFE